MRFLAGYKVTCRNGSVHFFSTHDEAWSFLEQHPDPSDPLYGGHPVAVWGAEMEYTNG